MKFDSPWFKLFLLFGLFAVFRLLAAQLRTLFGIDVALDASLFNKVLLVVLLLSYIFYAKLGKACGMVRGIKFKLLPVYWPFLAIGALTTLGANPLPGTEVLIKIALFALMVAISEELMFRGLVMHWFSAFKPRALILISGVGFGAVHLFGLTSDLPSSVIFAQVYFAAGLGITFAYARYRDVSIWLAIIVHFVFDLVAIGSRGGVSETFADTQQAVFGLLFAGSIAWAWGLFLLWRAGKTNTEATSPA